MFIYSCSYPFTLLKELCAKGAETIQSKSQYAQQATNELCTLLLTVDTNEETPPIATTKSPKLNSRAQQRDGDVDDENQSDEKDDEGRCARFLCVKAHFYFLKSRTRLFCVKLFFHSSLKQLAQSLFGFKYSALTKVEITIFLASYRINL